MRFVSSDFFSKPPTIFPTMCWSKASKSLLNPERVQGSTQKKTSDQIRSQTSYHFHWCSTDLSRDPSTAYITSPRRSACSKILSSGWDELARRQMERMKKGESILQKDTLPPKLTVTNISPENCWIERLCSFWNGPFSGDIRSFSGRIHGCQVAPVRSKLWTQLRQQLEAAATLQYRLTTENSNKIPAETD